MSYEVTIGTENNISVTLSQVGQQGVVGPTGTLEANAVNGDFNVSNGTFFVDVSTGLVGVGTEVPAYKLDVNGTLNTSSFYLGGTEVTATASELNILDGVTATASELNILDGVTATASELNILDGVTASTAELNLLDGVTASTAELNLLDGVTALGSGADKNVIVGIGAGAAVTTGQGNILIGEFAGESLTEASNSIAIGNRALQNCVAPTLNRNLAIGFSSLNDLTTGINNVSLGSNSGGSLTTGSNNLTIGYAAGVGGSPFTITTESNRIVLGNDSITNAYVKVAWTVTSDERDKTDFAPMPYGLDVVDAIDTFTFKFDNRSNYFVYDDDGNIIEKPTPDGTHKSDRTFVGFKAQQVQSVLDEAGFPSDVVVDTEDPENLKMKETALIPLLINAIKELKARIEVLENAN